MYLCWKEYKLVHARVRVLTGPSTEGRDHLTLKLGFFISRLGIIIVPASGILKEFNEVIT